MTSEIERTLCPRPVNLAPVDRVSDITTISNLETPQAVRRRLLMLEASVQFQSTLHEISGEQIGTGASFPPSTSFPYQSFIRQFSLLNTTSEICGGPDMGLHVLLDPEGSS
jgi:hypothetical protein